MLKIGRLYKKYRRVGNVTAYRMCRVLEKTKNGYLVDFGNGQRDEIAEKEAEKMEEVR